MAELTFIDDTLPAAPTADTPRRPKLRYPFAGQYPVMENFNTPSALASAGRHVGVDFGVPDNTPITTADDGVVEKVGKDSSYGNFVDVRHWWGVTRYGHLNSVQVKRGDSLDVGTALGMSGSTGKSTGPHLHFEATPDSHINAGQLFLGRADPLQWIEALGGGMAEEPKKKVDPVQSGIKTLSDIKRQAGAPPTPGAGASDVTGAPLPTQGGRAQNESIGAAGLVNRAFLKGGWGKFFGMPQFKNMLRQAQSYMALQEMINPNSTLDVINQGGINQAYDRNALQGLYNTFLRGSQATNAQDYAGLMGGGTPGGAGGGFGGGVTPEGTARAENDWGAVGGVNPLRYALQANPGLLGNLMSSMYWGNAGYGDLMQNYVQDIVNPNYLADPYGTVDQYGDIMGLFNSIMTGQPGTGSAGGGSPGMGAGPAQGGVGAVGPGQAPTQSPTPPQSPTTSQAMFDPSLQDQPGYQDEQDYAALRGVRSPSGLQGYTQGSEGLVPGPIQAIMALLQQGGGQMSPYIMNMLQQILPYLQGSPTQPNFPTRGGPNQPANRGY